MSSRPSTAAPILAVLAIALVMLGGIYVGGYLWLGEVTEITFDETYETAIVRSYYPHSWGPMVFQPAAKVESWLRGCEVLVER